ARQDRARLVTRGHPCRPDRLCHRGQDQLPVRPGAERQGSRRICHPGLSAPLIVAIAASGCLPRPKWKDSFMARILVLYYSSYGHIAKMADAVAEGVRQAGHACDVRRVPETAPPEVAQAAGFIADESHDLI